MSLVGQGQNDLDQGWNGSDHGQYGSGDSAGHAGLVKEAGRLGKTWCGMVRSACAGWRHGQDGVRMVAPWGAELGAWQPGCQLAMGAGCGKNGTAGLKIWAGLGADEQHWAQRLGRGAGRMAWMIRAQWQQRGAYVASKWCEAQGKRMLRVACGQRPRMAQGLRQDGAADNRTCAAWCGRVRLCGAAELRLRQWQSGGGVRTGKSR